MHVLTFTNVKNLYKIHHIHTYIKYQKLTAIKISFHISFSQYTPSKTQWKKFCLKTLLLFLQKDSFIDKIIFFQFPFIQQK